MAWFTDADLRAAAGARSYERGFGYIDAVNQVGELPDGVVATVYGTGRYRVRLTGSDSGELGGDCTCPFGDDGNFCKHCVAVGLYVLRRPGPAQRPDLRALLAAIDHAELVELVWQHAAEDADLYRKLCLRAATSTAEPDLAELQRQVDGLCVEVIGYGDEYAYAAGAEEVRLTLERMLPADPTTVQPLLLGAMWNIGAAACASGGEATSITEVAYGTWDTYRQACEAAPPDPVAFARWYLTYRSDGPDWPELPLDEVADLLGDAGLAALRQGIDDNPDPGRLRHLREEIVDATGTVDDLIALLAEDPYQYLRVAHLLRAEGRRDEAIAWLERYPEPDAAGVVDLLADLYAEAGRDVDLVALRERHFTKIASVQTYTDLRAAAKNTAQWPAIRRRAVALLQERAEAKAWYAAETLAAVLLDEGEVDKAWRVTQKYRCTGPVMLAVAARRGETHPADAVKAYRPLVAAAIAQTSNDGYARAAELLLAARPLFDRAGADFAGYVGELKEFNRRKRNFLAELGRNGL